MEINLIAGATPHAVRPMDRVQVILDHDRGHNHGHDLTFTFTGAQLHIAHALLAANPGDLDQVAEIIRIATGLDSWEALILVKAAECIVPVH